MVEHPKFEGHVTLNDDEYQKYVRIKFRYRLGVSYNSPSVFFDYMHTRVPTWRR